MPTLRLLSYNIRSMRDDRAALARVIRSAAADVVVVQEAPRFLRWRSTCAALARTSGLVVVGGGRTAGANLVMSTLGVDAVSVSSHEFSRDPRLHRRGCVIAIMRYRGTEFAVVGTHLDVVAHPRLRHAAELNAVISATVPPGLPVIIGADVNDHPGTPTWQELGAERVDAWAAAGAGDGFTSRAREPHQRIDGIFVTHDVAVRSAAVPGGPDVLAASDHRPVLVEVELP